MSFWNCFHHDCLQMAETTGNARPVFLPVKASVMMTHPPIVLVTVQASVTVDWSHATSDVKMSSDSLNVEQPLHIFCIHLHVIARHVLCCSIWWCSPSRHFSAIAQCNSLKGRHFVPLGLVKENSQPSTFLLLRHHLGHLHQGPLRMIPEDSCAWSFLLYPNKWCRLVLPQWQTSCPLGHVYRSEWHHDAWNSLAPNSDFHIRGILEWQNMWIRLRKKEKNGKFF